MWQKRAILSKTDSCEVKMRLYTTQNWHESGKTASENKDNQHLMHIPAQDS